VRELDRWQKIKGRKAMPKNLAVLDTPEDEFLLEADTITRRGRLNPKGMSRSEQSRVNVLLARSAALRNHNGAASRPLSERARHRPELRAFAEWLKDGRVSDETRTLLAGTQGVGTWTQGPAGGYLVPQEFYTELVSAIAQADPLLSADVVRLITDSSSSPLRLRPMRVAGWDLSTASASQVSESTQESAVTPTVGGATLNGFLFREEIAVSMEFEQDIDAFFGVLDTMSDYYQQAFRVGIGAALVNGTGSGQPQGILTGATNSGVTTGGSGVLVGDDFEAIYFAVNKAYRSRPRCAWVMSDTTYLKARKSIDANSRPLISIERDEEKILGKPVLISPSMPSAAGSKGIVFGDLGHFVVRLSGMEIARTTQTIGAGSATYGEASYKGRMRADSAVFDPSGGATPPIVYATLHA
jgi:HK97 family phage major capsid protein